METSGDPKSIGTSFFKDGSTEILIGIFNFFLDPKSQINFLLIFQILNFKKLKLFYEYSASNIFFYGLHTHGLFLKFLI